MVEEIKTHFMATEKNTPEITPSSDPSLKPEKSEVSRPNVSEDTGAEDSELEADDLEGDDYEDLEADTDSEDD